MRNNSFVKCKIFRTANNYNYRLIILMVSIPLTSLIWHFKSLLGHIKLKKDFVVRASHSEECVEMWPKTKSQ